MSSLSNPIPSSSFVPSLDEPGARAVEVAAMLGDSVVGVKHCMDPRGGKLTSTTWGLLGAAAACLVSSAVAFKVSVDEAAYNRAKLDYHVRVAKRPAYSFRPKTHGVGLDLLMFGGFTAGLAAAATGLARVRRERRSPYYRIGTAPGVEQPVEGAPSPAFPLIAPSGDDFVFNYGAGMDGEMIVDGATVPFAQLAASGRARPSATTPGAIEVPIPANARIRARAGGATFLVSAVPRPRAMAVPVFAIENRTAAFLVGSLAAHIAVWGVLQTIEPDGNGANLEFGMVEDTSMHSATTNTDDAPPDPPDNTDAGNDSGSEGQGAKMALAEGTMGEGADKPRQLQIQNTNRDPAIARAQAIEAARNAGFLGSASALEGGVAALASNADYSSGFDGANVYGSLIGADGMGAGNFGGGVHGFGPGGGCTQEPCGIIGTSRYGTIGTGTHAGDGWGVSDGHGPFGRPRKAGVPEPVVGTPRSVGDLDKNIIRRYVKRYVTQIGYCYEKELLAKPGLEGSVAIQFLIAGDGTVQSSSGSGMDNEVASCVAGVVKQIKFPRPSNGGAVQVNYPFNFHPTGR